MSEGIVLALRRLLMDKLLKLVWRVFKFVVQIACADDGPRPVCGVYEAYERRDRDEISTADFIEATRPR